MKLRKAIFVTVLVSVMLAVIDACLYILCNPAFIALTGAVVVYGLLRGATDFCYWLSKPEPATKHLAKKQPHVSDEPTGEPNGVYAWAANEELEEKAPTDPDKTAAMMRVLDEEV